MLLINPAQEQFGGVLSRYVPVGVPVAIGYLAAYLEKHKIPVKVYDEELGYITEDKIREMIQGQSKPHIVGITVLTSQALRVREIMQMVRNVSPDCVIVTGGIHATAVPHEILEYGADYVVRGEGEVPLLQLYRAIKNGIDASQIDSVSYVNEKGEVIHNKDALLIEDLDEIPMFPYHLFEHPKYDMGFITSSRGCPYKCTYCSQRLMTGSTYRIHSTERVVATLKVLIEKYGVSHISFYDDNFSVKKSRVKELCDGIVEAGLHKKSTFFVQTRADNLYPEIMPYLKKANFKGVGFGMETGVERLALAIEKDQTVARHLEAVKLCKEWGLSVSVFMIFGLPNETQEDRKASFELIKSLDLGFTKFNNLIPYPGTKLYRQVQATPEIVVSEGWSNFNSTLTATRSIFDKTPLPYVPKGTTPWRLKRDIMRWNYSFYFNPSAVWKVLTREDGPGWFMLPKHWYFKPREIAVMTKLFVIFSVNLVVASMPERLGAFLYRIFTGVNLNKHRTEINNAHLPKAIDGTARVIKVDRSQLKARLKRQRSGATNEPVAQL